MGGCCGQREIQEQISAGFPGVEDCRGAVDVTLDKVSAEACGGEEGAFQIDLRTHGERAEIRAGKGFAKEIKTERLFVNFGDGEAATVYRNAFAERDLTGEWRGFDGKTAALAVVFE